MPADAFEKERGDFPTTWSMGVLNDKLTHEVPGELRLDAPVARMHTDNRRIRSPPRESP